MSQCSQCGFTSAEAFTYCPSCGTRSLPGEESGLVGRILNGKYRLVSEIGAGSMGTVYLGEHVSLKKRVALKVLHSSLQVSDETLKRFQREGIAAGQVDHPNAIQIFDFDRTEDGLHFLAMEYVKGENLGQWLEREGPMPPERAVALMRKLLGTLVEAHRHGIVHRDLKPENIMVVTARDGSLGLKVLDFGLSKLVDRPLDASMLTVTGRVMGTPLYMAPEQWHGEDADQRTDLYSACLILYEMLAGQQPFKGSNLTETLVKSTTEPPPSLLEQELPHPVPTGLDEVLQKGLAKERGDRFQSAGELLDALDGIDFERVGRRGRRRPLARRRRRAAPTRRPERTRPRLVPIGVAVGVLAVAAGAFAFFGGNGTAGAAGPLLSRAPETTLTDQQRGYLSLLDDARDSWRTGNLASALAAADKATRMACADAEAFAVRAEVYRRQDDLDTAQADYREALSRYPGFALAAAGLGWIHLQRGETEDALRRFETAIEDDPDCGDGFAGKAAILCRRGRHRAAVELLDSVASRLPDSAVVHLYRGRAQLALGMSDEAVQSFVQAKRADPSLNEAYEGLGDAYLNKQEHRAAEQQYRQALEGHPNPTRLRAKLAELLLAMGRFEEAGHVLAPALEADAQDASLLVMHGLAEQGRGDRAAAIDALEKGLSLGAPEPARIHLLLGTLHFEGESWQKAARHCEEAVLDAALPEKALAAAYRTWGLAMFRMDDYQAAAFRLEQARRHDRDDPLVRYTLGVLYMDYLSRPEDAAAEFEAYRELGGEDPKVVDWLRTLDR